MPVFLLGCWHNSHGGTGLFFRQDQLEHKKIRSLSARSVVYSLLDPSRSLAQVVNAWVKLINNPEYLTDPDLARALEMLTPEKLAKLTAYLDSPLGQRVRTNNHVERTNRRLRYLEKVRYKWRRRPTIVRFLVLAFDHWRGKQASTTHEELHTCTQTLQEPSSGPTRRAA